MLQPFTSSNNIVLDNKNHDRLATPFRTSQLTIDLTILSVCSDPSKTKPNPPFITSPHPTPPPLCKLTHVAPRIPSPIKFCTAISAVNAEPS
ncbi:hypothetical protein BpHYR1_048883 [Brachionus plicatilis]|uniref:Uncharacterized protein n=1 Tax=Brachionus plicatilis TaxID=10195 RepID=A0A3M7QKK0_BRAPC|nr:hypothetical protein BpHYR1_048883 [Brachionus plicatilis]